MMDVDVYGYCKSLDKEKTKFVIQWMGRELRLDQYKNPIYIEVIYSRKLVGDILGYSIWEDTNYRPREFSIELSACLGKYKTIETLIHECIHIKQFATGKMKDFTKTCFLKMWCKEIVDIEKLNYEEHPWEIEAYHLEQVYYKKFISERRI